MMGTMRVLERTVTPKGQHNLTKQQMTEETCGAPSCKPEIDMSVGTSEGQP